MIKTSYEEELNRKGSFTYTNVGISMLPLLCQGRDLFTMNYYVTGNNVELNLGGFELKCEKCKRVLRLKNYTETMLIEHSSNGVFKV